MTNNWLSKSTLARKGDLALILFNRMLPNISDPEIYKRLCSISSIFAKLLSEKKLSKGYRSPILWKNRILLKSIFVT